MSGATTRAAASGAFAKGQSPKKIVGKIKRKLAKMRLDIGFMGLAFEDIDNCLVAAGEDLITAFDAYEAELTEGLEYWQSSAEDDQ